MAKLWTQQQLQAAEAVRIEPGLTLRQRVLKMSGVGISRGTAYGWIRQERVSGLRKHQPLAPLGTNKLSALKDALIDAASEVEKLEPLYDQMVKLEALFRLLDKATAEVSTIQAKYKELDVRLLKLIHPVDGEGSLTGR